MARQILPRKIPAYRGFSNALIPKIHLRELENGKNERFPMPFTLKLDECGTAEDAESLRDPMVIALRRAASNGEKSIVNSSECVYACKFESSFLGGESRLCDRDCTVFILG